MYFIPRNNRLYSWGARVKPTYRYIVTGMSLTAIAGIWWYTLYQPLNSYIVYYHATRNALQQQIECHNLRVNDATRESIRTMQEDIEAYKLDGLPPEKQCLHIIEAARMAGLQVRSYAASKEKNMDWYVDRYMHIDLVGTLEQSLSFLMMLRNTHQLIQCTTLHGAHAGQDQFIFGLDIKTAHIL